MSLLDKNLVVRIDVNTNQDGKHTYNPHTMMQYFDTEVNRQQEKSNAKAESILGKEDGPYKDMSMFRANLSHKQGKSLEMLWAGKNSSLILNERKCQTNFRFDALR